MKRNEYGVNLDQGVPLESEEDFRLLHVPAATAERDTIKKWLRSGQSPLLVGGQIGTGKTTLIAKVFRDAERPPDVLINFDTGTDRQTGGAFWGVAVAGFIESAIACGVDLPNPSMPAELADLPNADWAGLLSVLKADVLALDTYRRRREAEERLAEAPDYAADFVRAVCSEFSKTGTAPIILAAGVDKIDPTTAAFFEVKPCLRLLHEFKTLFEVNVVHLFGEAFPGASLGGDRLCLTAMEQAQIVELLEKRLGRYADAETGVLPALANLSGGNPRQAVRLLSAYEDARASQTNPDEALAQATRAVARDLFALAATPSYELLKSVQEEGLLEAGLVTLPGDPDTARLAIFGNWLVLTGQPEEGASRWPATLNPVLGGRIVVASTPPDHEIATLRQYADLQDMSDSGLAFDPERADEVARELAQALESDIPCRTAELLDSIGRAFLSPERRDRTILAYRSPEVRDAIRAFLFAKANSYTHRSCRHVCLSDLAAGDPLEAVVQAFHEAADVLSVDFDVQLSQTALDFLESHRDGFVDREIIWWIPERDLRRYLPKWPQLRQLFQVFVLEEELLQHLSEEEIEEELAYLGLLGEDASGVSEAVGNLRRLLHCLRGGRAQ